MWQNIKEFFANLWSKFMDWWNEPISDEELEKLIEEFPDGNFPTERLYKNPIRRTYEKVKTAINQSVGKGGFAVLLGCFAVIGFIALTGSSEILAVTGIAVATVFGAMIAIQRFPWLEKMILKYFKIIDLAVFVICFSLAGSVFGFQVAAVTGLLVSIALIIWKTWKDGQLQEGAKKLRDAVMEQLAPEVAPEVAQ